MEICVAKRSVYFSRTHVKVQALDMHPWNYSLKLIKLKQVFAMVHQAEASRRAHVKIKEQGQHQFIADIDLVLLLIPLIQSLFYLLS